MKRSYDYVKKEDVQACKELVKTMIKRDSAKGNVQESSYYAYEVAKFFDCMYNDFRVDFDEWVHEQLSKGV